MGKTVGGRALETVRRAIANDWVIFRFSTKRATLKVNSLCVNLTEEGSMYSLVYANEKVEVVGSYMSVNRIGTKLARGRSDEKTRL